MGSRKSYKMKRIDICEGKKNEREKKINVE